MSDESDTRDSTVGIVGLGMMGLPMAANLLRHGHAVVACDIDPGRLRLATELGAASAANPADVARRAGTVISMVDTTGQAEEVKTGSGGLIEGVRQGDVIVSMSTIDPAALRRMAEKLATKGADLLDAPVSGMEKGAKEGTLKAFVGGTRDALERARPALEAMTSEIIHFGPVGSGVTMKLVNNMLIQIGWVVIAEGLALGAKAGLDPQQMVDAISKGTGNSVAFQYAAPRILARDFDGFRMDITAKDVELQTALAKSLQVPMPVVNAAQQVYQMARTAGLGSEDGVAVVKVYEQFTGVPVSKKSK